MSADAALSLTAWLVVAAVAAIAVEYAVLNRRLELTTGGMFDWRVLRLRRTFTSHRVLRPVDKLFGSRELTYLWAALGPLAAVTGALWFGAPLGLAAYTLLLMFIIGAVLRFPVGRDGADQLALFLVVALLAFQLVPSSDAAWIVLVLICAQMTASYFVSGLAKLRSRAWTHGDAMYGILSSSCYGHPRLARSVDRRVLYAAGLGLVAFEVAFPLVWIGGTFVGGALLVAGLAFHIGTWIVSGLNSFLLVFAAGYPALVWLIGTGALG